MCVSGILNLIMQYYVIVNALKWHNLKMKTDDKHLIISRIVFHIHLYLCQISRFDTLVPFDTLIYFQKIKFLLGMRDIIIIIKVSNCSIPKSQFAAHNYYYDHNYSISCTCELTHSDKTLS